MTRCGDMVIRNFQDGGRQPSWIWSDWKIIILIIIVVVVVVVYVFVVRGIT